MADQRKGGIETVVRYIARCAKPECDEVFCLSPKQHGTVAMRKYQNRLCAEGWVYGVDGWICPQCMKKR